MFIFNKFKWNSNQNTNQNLQCNELLFGLLINFEIAKILNYLNAISVNIMLFPVIEINALTRIDIDCTNNE